MKDIKNILISALVAFIVAGGFVAFNQPVQKVIDQTVTKFGATSPDFSSPYISYGDMDFWASKSAMRTATTTLCAIQSPSATSTLEFAFFSITTGTSTSATIDIATGTTAFATTTNLVSAVSIGSGATGQQWWSPVGGSVNDNTMAPNTWVLVKTAGAGLGGYTYTGSCGAGFNQTVY